MIQKKIFCTQVWK